jgi:hypothetical protein
MERKVKHLGYKENDAWMMLGWSRMERFIQVLRLIAVMIMDC